MADKEVNTSDNSRGPSESDNQSEDESTSGSPVESDEAIIRASGASENEVAIAMKEHLHDAPDGGGGAERDAFRVDDIKNSLEELSVFPVSRKEDMVEDLFRNHRAVIVNEIQQLANSGRTVRQIVFEMMKRLLSYRLMAQYSLKGMRGKLDFSKTEIYSVLKEAIEKVTRAAGSEVVEAIEACLRYAPDRVGGGGRQNPPN